MEATAELTALSTDPKSDLKRFLKMKTLELAIKGDEEEAIRYIRRMRVELSRARDRMKRKNVKLPEFRTKIIKCTEQDNGYTLVMLKILPKTEVIVTDIENQLAKIFADIDASVQEDQEMQGA